MSFLTREDYLAQIDGADLEALSMADSPTQDEAPVVIVPGVPAATIRDVAERNALDEVASYLRGRFDMVAAYALADEARSQQLVMMCVDVAIWHMCPRVAFRNISEVREKRYLAAIKWLTMAQTGKSNPDLPLYADDPLKPQQHTFKWGSQTARSHTF